MVSNTNASYACSYSHVKKSMIVKILLFLTVKHSVYELRPKPYGVELTIWSYDEEKDEFEVMNEETQ